MTSLAECTSCTVPTDHHTGLCSFCRSYAGPPVDSRIRTCCRGLGQHTATCPAPPAAEPLANAKLSTVSASRSALDALDALADDHTILLTAADLASAIAHLRAARHLLDTAARHIEGATR